MLNEKQFNLFVTVSVKMAGFRAPPCIKAYTNSTLTNSLLLNVSRKSEVL